MKGAREGRKNYFSPTAPRAVERGRPIKRGALLLGWPVNGIILLRVLIFRNFPYAGRTVEIPTGAAAAA